MSNVCEIPYWDLKEFWTRRTLTPEVIRVGQDYRIFVGASGIGFYCVVPMEEPQSAELRDVIANVLPLVGMSAP